MSYVLGSHSGVLYLHLGCLPSMCVGPGVMSYSYNVYIITCFTSTQSISKHKHT